MPEFETRLISLIGPLLEGVQPEHQPAIIAVAERVAGQRYRGWAEAMKSEEARSILAACADREDEIARRAEAVVGEAAAGVQATIEAAVPDLADRYGALFENHSLAEQFELQARAERAGASTWRALASGQSGDAEHELLTLAKLEETSADALQDLLARGLTD